jgi:eukaryotic-like serine/threonine-protein kinase
VDLADFQQSFDRLLAVPSDDDAVATLLRHARSSTFEGIALDRMREARLRLSPRVRLLVASAYWDRGDVKAATALANELDSLPAHMLASDLAAARGDLTLALHYVNKVMARDLDYPGAWARREHLRDKLGHESSAPRPSSGATEARPAPDSPYTILREVGRGGAGRVYEAEDTALQRRVALKIYHRPEDELLQLQNEAQVAIALEGEGVIRVFAVSPSWIALEWATLGSLGSQVDSKAQADWVLPVAKSLARIHAAGFVHNDVKPGNIVLHSTKRAVFTDFGIARPVGSVAPLGSLGYMSPRRTESSISDPREDVYGFGRVLQECAPERFAAVAELCLRADGPEDGTALLTYLMNTRSVT